MAEASRGSARARARFSGKVAIVTGGNSGIGREVCLALAREGAQVLVAARREAEGAETERLIRAAGGDALFVPTDVTRSDSVKEMVRRCIERYGRLDIAFNNAGITGSVSSTILEAEEADFDATIAVNLKGTWLCMKHEIPALLRGGGGSIVNCSSTAGLRGGARAAAYYSSKHGLIGLTKSVALEYAAQGIRINAVCPGMTETELMTRQIATAPEKFAAIKQRIPMGRAGSVSEIAAAVLWLCSDESSYSTGSVLSVDGGFVI
jgi:NAD(P)-dependent dehydrogenase (short-subunit alcohol dehydrogenase family)